jgi:phosphoenolpyruvate carboxykinase (GTP)
VPTIDALDLDGVDVSPEQMRDLLRVDPGEWREEIPLIREFFDEFGDKLPKQLRDALHELEARLEGSA